jgi:hypothetical protein
MHHCFKFLCLLFVVSMIVACSSSDETDTSSNDQADTPPASEWRYAFNSETQQLAAYSLEDDMNIIAQDIPERLLPNMAIPFGEYGGLVGYYDRDRKTTVYHVTPRRADTLDLDRDLEWYPVTQTERYVVLHGGPRSDEFGPIVLYDAQTGQLHHLQGGTRWSDQQWCCGFSADGSRLRYLSLASADASAWSIIERNLENGAERDFYASGLDFSDDFFEILAATDKHGEQWYWQIHGVNLVHPDGTHEVLNSENGAAASYDFVDDYFVERPSSCNLDCAITVHPLEGESVVLQIGELYIDDLTRIDETQFFTTDSDGGFWLLHPDATPQLIGAAESWDTVERSQSPDGRWLTLFDNKDDPTKLFIWDISRQEPVFEIPAAEEDKLALSRVFYSPVGQIMTVVGQPQYKYVAFNFETGESVTLPEVENEGRSYFEVLPDGSVLFVRYDSDTRTGLGIWRYNPVADTSSQVVPDGLWQPITLQTLR